MENSTQTLESRTQVQALFLLFFQLGDLDAQLTEPPFAWVGNGEMNTALAL
jgi:hypothetical protein